LRKIYFSLGQPYPTPEGGRRRTKRKNEQKKKQQPTTTTTTTTTLIMEPNAIVDSSSSSSSVTFDFWWNTFSVFVVRMGKLVLGIGSVIATLLYFKQDSMLYFPEVGGIPRRPRNNPRRYRSPAEHQIPFESHQIPCDDGVHIHAWLLLRQKPVPSSSSGSSSSNAATTTTTTTTPIMNTLPTILFFHGNAGNIGLRLPNALQMLQYLNANILLVEYRGYGDSDNVKPTEAGLKLDGQAALKFIHGPLVKHHNLNPQLIFLFGRSLGGAVALETALYAQQQQTAASSFPPLAGVILENTFLSIAHMVDHLMPVLAPFKALVLRIGWNNWSIVPQLTVPILFLAGASDVLVPHSHMKQLFATTTLSKLKQWHAVPDGTHNETWMQGGQDYWDAFVSFLKRAGSMATMTHEEEFSNDRPPDFGQCLNTTFSSAAPPVKTSAVDVPLMPTGFVGMARESMRDSSSTAAGAALASPSMDPSKKKM
jgi:abhydrolase domain-containing protein 13